MKYIKYLIFIFIFALILACSIESNVEELKIAIASDFYPFAFVENDTLKGVESELLSLLQERLKRPLTISHYSFTQLLENFYNEDYHLAIGGITVTEGRNEIFDFSTPYYNATQTFVALGNTNIVADSLPAVVMHKIGIINNSSSLLFLENTLLRNRTLPITNLLRYDSLEACLTALKNNQVSMILLENTIAQILSENHGLKIVFQYDLSEYYALAFKKESPDSLLVNNALEIILSSEEWKNIQRKWLIIP